MTVNPTLLILLAEGFGLLAIAFVTLGSVWLVRKSKQKRALRNMAARVNAAREARREESTQIATSVLHLGSEEAEKFAQRLEQAERGFVALIMTVARQGKAAQVERIDGELFNLLDRYRSGLLADEANAVEDSPTEASEATQGGDDADELDLQNADLAELNDALKDQLKTTTDALGRMVRASDAALGTEEAEDAEARELKMLDGEDAPSAEQGASEELDFGAELGDDITVSGASSESSVEDGDIEPTLESPEDDLFGEPATDEHDESVAVDMNDDAPHSPVAETLSKAS